MSSTFAFVTAVYYNLHICIHMFTLILNITGYIVTSDTFGFAAMEYRAKPKPSVKMETGDVASGSAGPPPPPLVFPPSPPSIAHVPDMRRPAEPAEPPAFGRPPANLQSHHTIALSWTTDGLVPRPMAESLGVYHKAFVHNGKWVYKAQEVGGIPMNSPEKRAYMWYSKHHDKYFLSRSVLDETDEATTDYAEAGSLDLTQLFYPWDSTTPSKKFEVMSWFEWSQQEFKRFCLLLPSPNIVLAQSKSATARKAGFGDLLPPPPPPPPPPPVVPKVPRGFEVIQPPPAPVICKGWSVIQPPPAPVVPK